VANKRRCPYCLKYNNPKNALIVKRSAFCSLDHAVKHSRDTTSKRRKKIQVEKSKKYRKAKADLLLNNLPHQKKLTQKVINRLAKLLDAGKPCIDCGATWSDYKFHGGHYRSVGSAPELRFDLRNIHGQKGSCNCATGRRKHKAGAIGSMYEKGLIRRYGQRFVNWLNGPHSPQKFTCDDLRGLRCVFSAEIKRLEAGSTPSRDWRALPD